LRAGGSLMQRNEVRASLLILPDETEQELLVSQLGRVRTG
jgi:hypothetical protein